MQQALHLRAAVQLPRLPRGHGLRLLRREQQCVLRVQLLRVVRVRVQLQGGLLLDELHLLHLLQVLQLRLRLAPLQLLQLLHQERAVAGAGAGCGAGAEGGCGVAAGQARVGTGLRRRDHQQGRQARCLLLLVLRLRQRLGLRLQAPCGGHLGLRRVHQLRGTTTTGTSVLVHGVQQHTSTAPMPPSPPAGSS